MISVSHMYVSHCSNCKWSIYCNAEFRRSPLIDETSNFVLTQSCNRVVQLRGNARNLDDTHTTYTGKLVSFFNILARNARALSQSPVLSR